MTTMNETEQAVLDLVVNAVDQGFVTDLEVALLLRTVRAYALRDAAKALNKHAQRDHYQPSFVSNWLFDRADNIEMGAL